MRAVATDADIDEVVSLAREIWPPHYEPIIGRAQVEYMLDTFQSAEAIGRQIRDGYLYYLIEIENGAAGYFALVPQAADTTMLLSKLYVRQGYRGRGLARKAVSFAEDLCRERGFRTLWLTVNKHNTTALAAYHKLGFVNHGSVVTDIGGGFVMDDYRMEKAVPEQAPAARDDESIVETPTSLVDDLLTGTMVTALVAGALFVLCLILRPFY